MTTIPAFSATTRPRKTLFISSSLAPFSQRCWAALGIHWPNGTDWIKMVHEGKNRWARPMFLEVFVVAAWAIWKERNDKHFRGIQPSFVSWRNRFKKDFTMLVHRSKQELAPCIISIVNLLWFSVLLSCIANPPHTPSLTTCNFVQSWTL